jgi:hypothetical protein
MLSDWKPLKGWVEMQNDLNQMVGDIMATECLIQIFAQDKCDLWKTTVWTYFQEKQKKKNY